MTVATELELADEAERSRPADGLTLAELKEIASDAGIPPQYVEKAAARVGYPIHGRSVSQPDDQSVACIVREVAGHVAEHQRERIVEDIETKLGPGIVTMIGGSNSAFIAGVFGASFPDFHIVLVILCGLLLGPRCRWCCL